MDRRSELHKVLCEALGNKHVYYQPPESVKMEYPAIRYSIKDVEKKSANNAAYIITKCYEIIVIDKKPDNEAIDKLLSLPMCEFDRHYEVNNLNHDVLTLYY